MDVKMDRNFSEEFVKKFISLDSKVGAKWDNKLPLFDHFFLVGAENLDKINDVSVIYSFPDKEAKNTYPADTLLFPTEKPKPFSIKNVDQMIHHVSTPNSIQEKLAFVKISGDSVTYSYSLVFQCSPFTRPSFVSTDLNLQLPKFIKETTVPAMNYAFVFVTKHPFPDLFFQLLKLLLIKETKIRSDKKNLKFFTKIGADLNPLDDPMDFWPLSSHFTRELILKKLLEVTLPTFGESTKIGTDELGYFSYTVPTLPFFRAPLLQFSSPAILEWIDYNTFNKLITAILLENFVAVVGNNLTKISKAVIYLSQVTTPFAWTCPVSSLVPPIMHDILNSPTPMLVGIPLSQISIIPEHYIIVNLEKKTVTFPEDFPLYSWNNAFENIFNIHLRGRTAKRNFIYFHTELCNLIETQIAVPLCQSIMTILDDNPRSMLDRERFISQFQDQDKPFVKQFLEAQHTILLVSHVCSRKTERASKGDLLGSNPLENLASQDKILVWDEDSQIDLRSAVYLPYM